MPRLVLSPPGSGPAVEIHTNRLLRGGSNGQIAGLLAVYPSGWFVYPLPGGRHPVRVNRSPVSAPRRLGVGDVLDIGGKGYVVSACGTGGPLTAKLVGPTCAVTAVAGDARGHEPRAGTPFLIGSAPECDLRVTADGVAPVHALLAYADAVWHVHDLTGRGVARLTGKPTPSTVAVSGEMLWVGPLELTLQCSPLDRLAADPDAGPADFDPPPPAPRWPTPVSSVEMLGQTGLDTLLGPAVQMCKWLQMEMPRLARTRADNTPTPTGGGWFAPSDPLAAFDYYKDQLTRRPADAQMMFAVANLLAEIRFEKLERLVLREMLKYHPAHFDLLARLAELMLRYGLDARQAAEDRRKDLERAERYATQALALRKDAQRLRDLREKAAVERTLLALPELAGVEV